MVSFLAWLFSPFSLALAGLFFYVIIPRVGIFRKLEEKRPKIVLIVFVWLLVSSQPLLVSTVGIWLEKPYPYIDAELQPRCDAIVLLGGGMGAPTRNGNIPEMFSAADRVWHAARLWHAGKAEYIIVSGTSEEKSSVVLLKDLGVPRSSIIVEDQALNTIGNGVYTYKIVRRAKLSKKILLVTSAKHMRRSMMIFTALGFEPIPAAVDHEATYGGWSRIKDGRLSKWQVLPSSSALMCSYFYYKECLGLLGDRIRIQKAIKHYKLKE